MITLFFIYINLTWQMRRTYANIDDYNAFLALANQSWNLQPSAWFSSLVDVGYLSKSLAMNIISITMYLTNSVVSLDKIIINHASFSHYYGVYEVGILSPLLQVFSPNTDIIQIMNQELNNVGIFGFYVSAGGSLFLDFGLIGTLVSIFIWGFLSGICYRYIRDTNRIEPQLAFSFIFMSIVVSPINSPIGMSNSFLILCSLLVVCWQITHRINFRRKSILYTSASSV